MKKIFFALSLLAVAATASAAEFADTSVPDQMIDLGVRFGISSSNLSADIPHAGEECNFSWKRGFTAGVVMNLNIRDFFSIQPGFYFENRSYDYSTIRHDADRRALETNLGHTRRYAFSIPVLASFHLNISNAVRWDVEAGPYFSFGIGDGKDEVTAIAVSAPSNTPGRYSYITGKRDYYGDDVWQHRNFDCGVQIGTGVEVMDHYVFNISYQRGLRNVAGAHDLGWSMKNKGWNFAIGYKF